MRLLNLWPQHHWDTFEDLRSVPSHVRGCTWLSVCLCVRPKKREWDFLSLMFPCVWSCLDKYECSCGYLRSSKHSHTLTRHFLNVFGHSHGQSKEISTSTVIFWCYTGSNFFFILFSLLYYYSVIIARENWMHILFGDLEVKDKFQTLMTILRSIISFYSKLHLKVKLNY